MSLKDTTVLPHELCKQIFRDLVKKPWISLKNILDYELYTVVLNYIMPEDCYVTLKGEENIKEWLSRTQTFQNFKDLVEKAVLVGDCNINLDAVNARDWHQYVCENVRVYDSVTDWIRGGGFTYTRRWACLNQSEDRREDMWRLLALT
jgi:hypothetical protein